MNVFILEKISCIQPNLSFFICISANNQINKMSIKYIISGLALMAVCGLAHVSAAPSTNPPAGSQPVIEPTIDWGKCPQLAPTEEQRKQKTEIIKACLEKHPLTQPPEQLNAEIVDAHRIKLGECALTKEDWVSVHMSL